MVGSVRNGLDGESHCFGNCASRRILLRRYPKLAVVSQLAEAVRIRREEAISLTTTVDESGGNQFCQRPYVVCNPRRHRGRDSQRPKDPAKVVVREVKGQGRFQIVPFL